MYAYMLSSVAMYLYTGWHLPSDIYMGARNPNSSLRVCMANAYPPSHLPSHLKNQVFKRFLSWSIYNKNEKLGHKM